jgi:glutamyl-tRNA synthetase
MSGNLFRGRFAPSPTGALHLGNLRTALLAWLFARVPSSTFVLRLDDLDVPRTRPGCAEAMFSDLHWLGLDWDEGPDIGGPYGPYAQSERSQIYRDHLERLRDANAVYPCYCSRRDIALAASAPHGTHHGSPYPGTCRDEDGRARQHSRHPERPPSYRFRVERQIVEVHDGVHGIFRQELVGPADDFIVWRSGGTAAYQLAAVVDDALMQIGEVVRGDDLLQSTVLQVLLYRALDYRLPAFSHVPLWLDQNGARLAKRIGSTGLQPLRASGEDPKNVVGMLAASCGLVPKEACCSATELVSRLSRRQLREVHSVRA